MSNPKVYVISDTHFGHTKILEFEKMRSHYKDIEEHDRDLVQRLNSIVRSEDTVWHLGDVYFGSKEKAAETLHFLKGYKRLVMGNHDQDKESFLRLFFDKIYGVAAYGKCILSHIPVHPSQLEFRYKKNIHGHMHSKHLDDKRYICVSAEKIDFKPTLLARLVQ